MITDTYQLVSNKCIYCHSQPKSKLKVKLGGLYCQFTMPPPLGLYKSLKTKFSKTGLARSGGFQAS